MQSFRAAQRIGMRAGAMVRSAPARANSGSNIAGGSLGKAWADKEHAAEASYFNKKDAELLSKLASKLHNHTAPSPQSIQQEKEALTAIFERHNVTPSEALLDEIIKFKFNH